MLNGLTISLAEKQYINRKFPHFLMLKCLVSVILCYLERNNSNVHPCCCRLNISFHKLLPSSQMKSSTCMISVPKFKTVKLVSVLTFEYIKIHIFLKSLTGQIANLMWDETSIYIFETYFLHSHCFSSDRYSNTN